MIALPNARHLIPITVAIEQINLVLTAVRLIGATALLNVRLVILTTVVTEALLFLLAPLMLLVLIFLTALPKSVLGLVIQGM